MKSLPATTLLALAIGSLAQAEPVPLQLRDRVEADGEFTMRFREQSWQPAETAVIVCDMWDAHHCYNAVGRVGELVPRMDAFLKAWREKGALVIHAPSSCTEFYKDHPARKRANEAPAAAAVPAGIGQWLNWIDDREEAAGYPIDHSDGGEDDDPAEHAKWAETLKARGLNPRQPWTRQVEGITIDGERDAITDDGIQTWNLLQARGVKNVLLVGVHTNMCVLGRPFGLRQMAKNGVNVALVRDLTDTMYNPAMPPKVNHFAGTDLIVEHVEKYVCPTVSSDQLLGGAPFTFAGDPRPKVVMLIGEREYRTVETLPRFAAEHLTADYRVQILHAADGSNDFGDVAGALTDADALFLSVRRRALEERHLDAVRAFAAAGKPILGIRTSSHAFSLRGKPAPDGHAVWEKFDPKVFGGSYTGHHGNARATFANVVAAEHPVTAGVDGAEFATGGSLYKVLPLLKGATVLLEGRADGIAEKQPVAWAFARADGGRSFYTSLGHVDDFERGEFVKLLENALRWVLDKKEQGAKTSAVTPRGRSPDPLPEGALSPEASLAQLRVPDDLVVDLVLSEPLISQPLHLSFDARGRLWVVEYRQYPDPAGLKELSRDKVWRVAYDRMPPPPPHAEGSPFRGKDRISIHEDADGDGVFDTHKVFADGLNMATSVAHGDGGVWVTNPPYLLFFPDRNGDDVPDGAPEVHLKGFGMEDSHSIANSLTLGPDGWLYGAQGSTVSAAIVRPGLDDEADAVRSMGQHIWRYHPDRKIYEIFAEGGGNAFGVEIDSKGRVYSGHNGGDTRGFHYIEGGYFQKTWGKHGALTNPHAYGFFPPMKHQKVARFVHQFLVYEDTALPERYRGKLWGVDILHRNLVLADLIPNGSTFRTEDIERVVRSDDPWFRPVMVTDAPDGSIYIADWYDEQVNHYKNHEGQIDHECGRVYRVRAKGANGGPAVDLASAGRGELVKAMASDSRWRRRMALVEFKKRFAGDDANGASALEEFWLQPTAAGLRDESAAVRREAVRLAGAFEQLAAMAGEEKDLEVLAQLAATARKAGTVAGLDVAETLARRDELAADPHLPLLVWWAIEHHLSLAPDAALGRFRDSSLWGHRIVRETLLERVMRRFASEGDAAGFERCAVLLQIAPDDDARRILVEGFARAIEGKNAGALPGSLLRQLASIADELPLPLRVRIGAEGAVEAAIARLGKGEPDADLVTALGALGAADGKVGVALSQLLEGGESEGVELAAISALEGHRGTLNDFDMLTRCLTSQRVAVRDAAASFLAADIATARGLIRAAGKGDVVLRREDVALIEKLRAHGDDEIDRGLGQIMAAGTESEASEEIARVRSVVGGGGGVPKKGEAHYVARCSACHTMFGKGGAIGPDLTSYQRDDREALLLAIVDPGAEIREGYEHTILKLHGGEIHSGFRIADDAEAVVLRDLAGARRVFQKDSIKSLEVTTSSLMPAGLLGGLTDDQLRDLFAYLRSTTPPY